MVELKKILNNRTYLMGIACILILIFHSNLPVINANIIKRHLYIGVDIFLFLSGIGIAQTLSKTKTKKEFYKSRLMKILPISLPLIVIFSLLMYQYVDDFTVKEFYHQTTLTNFILLKGNYNVYLWYIPTILIYYFISPYIYNFYTKKENKLKSFITLMMICSLLIMFTLPRGTFEKYSYFTNRLPIYIIGLIYGIRIKNNEKCSPWELVFMFFSSIVSLGIIYIFNTEYETINTLVKIISFIPITISISILISNYIEYLKLKNKDKYIGFLKVIGTYTLAIYTSHEALLFIIKGLSKQHNIKNIVTENPYIYALVIAVVAILFSILWTKFINYLKDNKTQTG